jgi:hypothetical protein
MTPTETAREFTADEWERGKTVPALKSGELDACFAHDHVLCPKCQSDAEWYAKLREAEDLERAARFARKVNLDANPDIERIAVEWERSALRLRAWLQATANAEEFR